MVMIGLIPQIQLLTIEEGIADKKTRTSVEARVEVLETKKFMKVVGIRARGETEIPQKTEKGAQSVMILEKSMTKIGKTMWPLAFLQNRSPPCKPPQILLKQLSRHLQASIITINKTQVMLREKLKIIQGRRIYAKCQVTSLCSFRQIHHQKSSKITLSVAFSRVKAIRSSINRLVPTTMNSKSKLPQMMQAKKVQDDLSHRLGIKSLATKVTKTVRMKLKSPQDATKSSEATSRSRRPLCPPIMRVDCTLLRPT